MRVYREWFDHDYSRWGLAIMRQWAGIITYANAAAADAHDAIGAQHLMALGQGACHRMWLTALQTCAAA